MKTDTSALDVLRLFATYGFRKVSMNDIARAADLSRQSIYNQYGSKEAVLEWAVTAFLNDATDAALSHLQTAEGDTAEILAQSMQLWTGNHVSLLSGTPHAAELLETAISSMANASRDYEGEFKNAVSTFMHERDVFQTRHEADEATFVLGLASKGLLLKSENSGTYALGMKRVISVLLGK